MTVFVLIREDQNAHGYVDTSIVGIYSSESTARSQEALEQLQARENGLVVDDEESADAEWEVSWRLEVRDVS